MICATCGGPAHPATGCQYTETFITCYRCTVEAWTWLRRHINEKGLRSGISFYEHAGKKGES